MPKLTRSSAKQHFQDGARVFLNASKSYAPETDDHQRCWPKTVDGIAKGGERGI